MPQSIRLQKYLSECGIASRRKAEEMILAKQVKVNGQPAQLGDKVLPGTDAVTVRGKRVRPVSKMVYIMLHKPRGFVTTLSDDMGRKCVAELTRDVSARIYPVGRLDRESEGLLLMTNDGELTNALTHPSKHVPKTYRVTVRPSITQEQLDAFAVGMMLDGRMTAPADVRVVSKEEGRVVIEVVLYEGRNRQIRKMCEQLGLEVARLKRTAIGNIKLSMLPPGRWRYLEAKEVEQLKNAVKMDKLEQNKAGENHNAGNSQR